tara:strand:+ start:322 stop:732 length:411 start_codon:yes stop_codon:yes gene_type:complete
MSAQIIREFNDVLGSFLVQIAPIIGSSYNHYFKQLVKVNSLMPIQQFIVYGYDYRDQIMKRDESYFSSDKNKEEIDKKISISKANQSEEKMYLKEIFRLEGIWHKLSKSSKENVWDFMQALICLSEEYIGKTKGLK